MNKNIKHLKNFTQGALVFILGYLLISFMLDNFNLKLIIYILVVYTIGCIARIIYINKTGINK